MNALIDIFFSSMLLYWRKISRNVMVQWRKAVLAAGPFRRISDETVLFHLGSIRNRFCSPCFGNRFGQNVFIRLSSRCRISREMASSSLHFSTGEQSLRGSLPTAGNPVPIRSLRVRDRLPIPKAFVPRLCIRLLSVPAVPIEPAPLSERSGISICRSYSSRGPAPNQHAGRKGRPVPPLPLDPHG